MATDRSNDLRAFKGFVDEHFASGGAELTLEEALTLWEYENSSQEGRDETIKAIQRGLDDMNAGRTVDAFEFVERIRHKIRATGQP